MYYIFNTWITLMILLITLLLIDTEPFVQLNRTLHVKTPNMPYAANKPPPLLDNPCHRECCMPNSKYVTSQLNCYNKDTGVGCTCVTKQEYNKLFNTNL